MRYGHGRVLVVDDFRQARESIADVLLRRGPSGRMRSPAAAKHSCNLESESFDVIVTDLQMPGMSGLEFIRHLEHRPHGRRF